MPERMTNEEYQELREDAIKFCKHYKGISGWQTDIEETISKYDIREEELK